MKKGIIYAARQIAFQLSILLAFVFEGYSANIFLHISHEYLFAIEIYRIYLTRSRMKLLPVYSSVCFRVVQTTGYKCQKMSVATKSFRKTNRRSFSHTKRRSKRIHYTCSTYVLSSML